MYLLGIAYLHNNVNKKLRYREKNSASVIKIIQGTIESPCM